MNRTKRMLLLVATTMVVAFQFSCAKVTVADKTQALTLLSGYAISLEPLPNAEITIMDVNGASATTHTNDYGVYQIAIDGLTPPLLVNAIEAGFPNISDNSKPRGRSVAALVAEVKTGQLNTVNLNPITDKMVSDVANELSLRGPVSLILRGNTQGISAHMIQKKTAKSLALIKQALIDSGVESIETYDPVTTPINKSSLRVYSLIRHVRGYDTKSGEISGAMLLDILFRPLSSADTLNYWENLENQCKLRDKKTTRVFLASDSTVANYKSEVAPRKGWGQMFHTQFKDDANVLIVNAAISGRSARSYINEGWLRMYEDLIQPGDYLFIEFGHNDEKCGSNPPKARDVFDNANTCTYPNDDNGQIQGNDDMSLQRWLEKYIVTAESKGATPVILTPITRINTASDKKTGVFPIEHSTHIVTREISSGEYVGNYAQTLRDTANAHNLALIDLEEKTMQFANDIGEPAWKQYWLAVDPALYPYYKEGKTGNINKPDTTHLQQNGAIKVANIVANQIKNLPSLHTLAQWLK